MTNQYLTQSCRPDQSKNTRSQVKSLRATPFVTCHETMNDAIRQFQAFGASCVADLPTVLASVGWAAENWIAFREGGCGGQPPS